MDISVVVPLYNEEESLPELYTWIERVMKANGFSFEIIFVNDGSTDHSWEVIEKSRASTTHTTNAIKPVCRRTSLLFKDIFFTAQHPLLHIHARGRYGLVFWSTPHLPFYADNGCIRQ